MVIINTCGFINDAKEESINTILNCKSSYPDKIVIAAGCLAQRYGKELSHLSRFITCSVGIPADAAFHREMGEME